MRVDGWEKALNTVLDKYVRREYRLGESDCLGMASEAVAAITGNRDRWAQDWKGRYETRDEAETLLNKYGGFVRTFNLFFSSRFRRDMRKVNRGDVCMFVDATKTPHLTICVGARMVGYFPDGLQTLPIGDASGYWEIV